jgi:carbon-monoxide dehydrogenase medium subunit
MYKTSYLRAKNLDEAGRILADAEDGRLLAGGMTLLPTLKQRLAAAEQLIDLADCGLAGIAAEEGGLRIGAMTRHYSGPRPAGRRNWRSAGAQPRHNWRLAGQ